MDGFAGGSDQDQSRLGGNSTDGSLFDASQYAFFGGDIVEEVELGGLEDEEELPAAGFDDGHHEVDRAEDADLGPLNEIDDLANSFSKLNRVASGPPSVPRAFDGRVSTESSAAADWAKDSEYSPWNDQHGQLSAKSLYRASSYPEPQLPHQQHNTSTPIPVPKSSFPSYPPGMPQQGSPNSHLQHPNIQYVTGQPQMSPPQPFSHFPSGLSHNSHFGGNLSQLSPPGHSVNSHPPGHWANQANMYHGERPNIYNILQQQSPQQNGLRPHIINHHQQQQQQQQHPRLLHPIHPNFSQLPGMHPQMYGSHLSASPPMMNKFEGMLGLPDMMEQRPKFSQRNRQEFDYGNRRYEGGWPQYRSKYMTASEIENIIRMQLAATHSNDPYVDDYYHQACLAKKSAGARSKHHFCPNFLRELPPHGRASDEPHAYLQVEALGRMPFSSVRRPKPLLEMEPAITSGSGGEQKAVEKSLEQEPLLAARVVIEDGICLILDVDDIDRFLQFNNLPDGGSELNQRRKVILEGLTSSFQLIDPLSKDGRTTGLAPKDDLVFLRIISLPKGRKLLLRYLAKLRPGDELLRVVCMAIFRHLRFLFGGVFSDPPVAETTTKLAITISSHVSEMDLRSLSACLAAVVCSSEQPPLRPIGSSPGDGASVILNSVLERAKDLLKDPHTAAASLHSRPFWQASFNEFFGLLIKYCVSKHDSVMQPLLMQSSLNKAAIESEAARAFKKEMPVELLRSSLPHMNEYQKNLLMEFSQRSVLGAANRG
ncbi:hypothetical protein V2J09_001273 [Rumex salicifolius]